MIEPTAENIRAFLDGADTSHASAEDLRAIVRERWPDVGAFLLDVAIGAATGVYHAPPCDRCGALLHGNPGAITRAGVRYENVPRGWTMIGDDGAPECWCSTCAEVDPATGNAL